MEMVDTDMVDITEGQVGSLLLDLSAGLTLGFELLLDLFDAGGELLDLLAGLVDGGLLVLELGHEGSVLEVLALGGLVHVALDALQVVDGSEGLLQLRLQLPLDLSKSERAFFSRSRLS